MRMELVPDIGLAPLPSDVLHQPERIIDRRVCVSRADRIADAEELKLAIRVARDLLRAAFSESVVVDCAGVRRQGLEFEIEIVER